MNTRQDASNKWTPDIEFNQLDKEILMPGRSISILIAGILVGVGEIIFAVSIGNLVFSGELVPYLPYGIGIALVTTAITIISISILSSIKGVIGTLQDSPSVIISLTVSALIAGLIAKPEIKFATVVVIIAITSLLTGLFLFALGYYRLGGLVRYIPYPVIGGFLAGTGLLLVQGSFRVMADYSLTISNLQMLFQPDQLILWLPGVIFAFILFISLRRIKHYLVMPGVLLVAFFIFYLGLLVSDSTISEAIQRGLLLSDSLKVVTWRPIHFTSLTVANWSSILGQAGNILIIMILSVISLLINSSALELSLKQDINLNHELQTAGIANILSGLGGGMVGYHTLDASTLSARLGSRDRFVGIIAGILCLIVLFAGASLLVYFPRFISGGLLFFLGMDFLFDWVIKGWSRLTKVDYFVVILIVAIIATTDFLIGVAAGFAVMIILFVINYSRVDVVRHALSGGELRSNVERQDQQLQTLKKYGDQIFILELQGFIFFGTANALVERIRARLSDTQRPQAHFIILDFRRVNGLDSSAVFSFIKFQQIAEKQGIKMILTSVNEKINHQLKIGGLFTSVYEIYQFPDLDRGLEYCEENLLKNAGDKKYQRPGSLHERLMSAGFQDILAERMIQKLEKVEVDQGEYLAHQGELANDMYFVEHGKLSIYLELENDERVRLQTLDMRTIVGELGLYLNTLRTASIIADEPSVAYRLTRTALNEIKEHDPDLAATLHEFVARKLAERLADTTKLLAVLSN